ncbi:unnamed protein product [Adineta steineri]|uniref:Uncharacterized protein n=1 Tax=Adineta steineri TaxID=433720 RepID=A0A814IH97_9BILA|nr:unnamed protein product [Adineta steineri]CAF3589710.1 unnamed protein product [Adineta steineri]
MFNTLLFLVCCCSLVGSSLIDPVSNKKHIDGTQYTIKSVSTKYKQHVSDQGECSIELKERPKFLVEGEIIKIKNKWFKVEECRLNRAYRASCGSRLFYQLRDLACAFVEQNQDNQINTRREVTNMFIDESSYDVCCESACTISELLQYCPTKW